MIIFIIIIALFLLCVIGILHNRWEVQKDEEYHMDQSLGNDEIAAYKLKEWETDRKAVTTLLMETYVEDYNRLRNEYSNANSSEALDRAVFDNLKYYKLPYKKVVNKKVVLNDCWSMVDIDEPLSFFSTIIGGFILLGLIISGGCCLGVHSTWGVQEKTTELNELIVELENDKMSLLSFYDAGTVKDIDISASNLPNRVVEHNYAVAELSKDIRKNRIALTNPWVNWFVCPAYADVDIARVEATYINLQ